MPPVARPAVGSFVHSASVTVRKVLELNVLAAEADSESTQKIESKNLGLYLVLTERLP